MSDVSKVKLPTDANGIPMHKAMGKPLLFDGGGSGYNLGVANQWVTLLDISNYGKRVFVGISCYNPSGTVPVYLDMVQAVGSESSAIKVNPNQDQSFDELTFGPGTQDESTGNSTKLIRAMVKTAVGLPAKGTATYTTNPSAGSYLTIGSTKYELVSALGAIPPSGTAYSELGSTLAATLTSLAAAINASDSNVTATATSTVLTVQFNFCGTGPNAYVFADGTTATGGTFTGSGTLGGSGAAQVGTAGVAFDLHIW